MTAIFLLVIVPLIAQSPQKQENFKFVADFAGEIQKNTVYRFPLPVEVFKKCFRLASEIRIFDSTGLEIPFLIIDNKEGPEVPEYFDLEITGYNDFAGYSIVSLKSPKPTVPIIQLQLSVPQRDFKKSVELAGSYDQKIWTVLAKDSIYDFSSQVDLRKTDISFAKSDFPNLRLKISDDMKKNPIPDSIQLKYDKLEFRVDQAKSEKLRFDRITAKAVEKTEKKMIMDQVSFQSLPIELNKERNSEINLEANLPFSRIDLGVDGNYFYRTVSVYGSESGEKDAFHFITTGAIYKFPLLGREESKSFVEPTPFADHYFRYYKIIVENKNNPPLDIKKITFLWIQKNLFFVGLKDNSHYRLFVGNPDADLPDYDIARFIRPDNWQQLDAKIVEAGPVVTNTGFSPKPAAGQKSRVEKIILMAVVFSLVILIGYFIFQLMKKTPT